MYSISDAAKATGRSKSTILRAIQNGKISGSKNEDGKWELQPVDVHNRYPMVHGESDSVNGAHPSAHHAKDATRTSHDVPDLLSELMSLRAKLEVKEEVVKAHQATIDDLRDRLTQEVEERRQATTFLLDQRAKPEPRKGVLARLFG